MIDLQAHPAASQASRSRRNGVPTAPPLTAERERELAARIRTGDFVAREELILTAQPLVRTIASAFRGRDRVVDLNDLIQEGNLGLLRAASDFDPESHGTRFVNYAACWIRYRIRRALAEQSTTIRYPYYLVLLRRRFEKERGRMIASNEPDAAPESPATPDFDEVIERMDVDASRLRFLQSIRDQFCSSTIESLDDPSHESSLARSCPPQQPLEIAESMEKLHAALQRLSLMESWVLRRRYRLENPGAAASRERPEKKRRSTTMAEAPGPPPSACRSYRELSMEIGMPPHQIRAIERSAISKLHRLLAATADLPLFRDVQNRPLQAASRRSA